MYSRVVAGGIQQKNCNYFLLLEFECTLWIQIGFLIEGPVQSSILYG